MNKSSTLTALVASLAVAGALVGCDVEKTRDGDVTLPKIEVEKTQEGNVTLPKYDVTTPDVKVGSKEVDVAVPKVTTEKETISVPTVDIKTADEKKAEGK